MTKTFMVIFIIVAVICAGAAIWNLVMSTGRRLHRNDTLVTADVKAARKTRGIVLIIVAAVFVIAAILINAGGASGKGGDKKDKKPSSATSGSAVEAEENDDSITLDEAALPEVNLNESELDLMFSGYDRFFLRSSMPSMASFKVLMTEITPKGKISQKQGFSGSVAIPMWADQRWFDEGMGLVRDTKVTSNSLEVTDMNVGPKANLSAKVRETLKNQAVIWMKEFRQDLKNAKDADEVQMILRTKVYQQILANPVFGDMVVQWLATEQLATLRNPWLPEFKAKLDAAYATEKGVCTFLQYDAAHLGADKDAWMRVTDDYWYDACRVCALLENFVGIGLKDSLKSVKNWYLPMGSDANQMRTEENPDQEKRETFVLVYRSKSGKDLLKIGFNVTDMRLEIFSLKNKVKIKTPDTTPDDTATPKPSVTVPPSNTPQGKLVVHYKFKNGPKKGQKAAEDESVTKYVGQIAEIESPKIKGYTASKTVVSAKIKKGTIERTVYYIKNGKTPRYTLTIKYKFKDGSGSAAPTYNQTGLKKGERYSQESPKVTNHKPDKAIVSGTMPGHDVVITVLYSRNTPGPTPTPNATPHKLTINYKFKGGGQAASPHKETLYAGDGYNVTSPKIKGYKPSKAVVSGTMPDRDLTVTVVYTKDGDGAKDPAKDPVQNDKAPTGGGDNKPGNGNGDAQSTPKPASATMTPKPSKAPVESNDENGTVHGGNPPAAGNITNDAQTGTDGNGNKIPTATDKPAGKLDSDGF